MGKLGLLLLGAVVGWAYLEKKKKEENLRRRTNDFLTSDGPHGTSTHSPKTSRAVKYPLKDDSDDSSEDDSQVDSAKATLSTFKIHSPSTTLAETQTYHALCTPKNTPVPLNITERERQRLKQAAVNISNAKVYDGLSLRQGQSHIRVLRIEPNANLYAALKCKLEITTMDSKYIALSYTWGPVDDRMGINIDGQIFSATRDLEVALRHLRAYSVDRVVWIDAICINQGNEDEVRWHMDCMRDVYAGAEGTMIWVGEGNSRSDFAIKHFNNPKLNNSDALITDYKSSREAWMCLEELVDRRWWSRLWIVQEAIVSKLPLIVCGRSFWKFTDFTKIIGFALAHKLDIFSPVIRDSPFTKTVVLLELFRARWAENPGFHLEYYIMVFGLKHNCLNPSDKIRALLGLTNHIDRRGVTLAGYRSDDPPSVMYRKIAAYIVTHRYHNSELDFLCLGRGPRRGMNFLEGTPPLPTWVPDLSIPPWESFATLTRNAWETSDDFSASKSRTGVSTPYSREVEHDGGISVSVSGLILTVRGILVDTVKHVGDVYDLDLDNLDFSSGTSHLSPAQKAHHKAILDQAINITNQASDRNKGIYPRQWPRSSFPCQDLAPCCEYKHAASQTLTCGRDPGNGGKPYKDPLDGGLFKYPCASFCPVTGDFETQALLQGELNEGSMDRHFRRLRRAFMVSETGYLGIVPPGTRTGDYICVLYGCSVPVVLRGIWRGLEGFIGECYVHGIMYGEALDDVVAGRLEEREFNLV